MFSINLPDNIKEAFAQRAKNYEGKEAPSDVIINDGGGGFYSNLFNPSVTGQTPRIYKPIPNVTDGVIILPAVFPFTPQEAERMKEEGYDVANLSPTQRSILLDPEAIHGLSSPKGQPTLNYFSSPLMLAVAYGTDANSRKESPTFGFTKPFISAATTALYPGLWEEIEGGCRPLRDYRLMFQNKLGNQDFWSRIRSKPLDKDEKVRREECMVILPTLYVVCWVLPLHSQTKENGWEPELMWIKVPAGANAFSRGGSAPKAKPLWDALVQSKESGAFHYLADPSNPTVFTWKMTQPKGPADARESTSYQGGEMVPLDSSRVKGMLEKMEVTKEDVKDAIATKVLPFIAASPMSSILKVLSPKEELDMLNEYLAVKGEEAHITSVGNVDQLVVTPKQGNGGNMSAGDQGSVEMPNPSEPENPTSKANTLSREKVRREGVGTLLTFILDMEADSVMEKLFESNVCTDSEWENLLSGAETGNGLISLDRDNPNLASKIRQGLIDLCGDKGYIEL